MKVSLLHPHLKSLFPDNAALQRFLRAVKKMPQPENTTPGKVPEDFGLFVKEGNWNLLYYSNSEGKPQTRMLSLKTQDIYLCREVRDNLMAVLELKSNKHVVSGLRGARWAVNNPEALNGVRIAVYLRGPERGRKFYSTGDLSCVDKALTWRTETANKYLAKHTPCSAPEKK